MRYPAAGLTAEQVAEIRRIKARVDSERLPRGADPATHTKLGRGGLADVEWTVQLLQLQHAAGVPELQVHARRSTALAALGSAGLLDADAARRRCGRRGSWPPAPATRSSWCAAGPATSCPGRAWSWPGSPGPAATAPDVDPGQFLDDYRRTTRHARTVVEQVFYGGPAAG